MTRHDMLDIIEDVHERKTKLENIDLYFSKRFKKQTKDIIDPKIIQFQNDIQINIKESLKIVDKFFNYFCDEYKDLLNKEQKNG